jgi:hypothetical protein
MGGLGRSARASLVPDRDVLVDSRSSLAFTETKVKLVRGPHIKEYCELFILFIVDDLVLVPLWVPFFFVSLPPASPPSREKFGSKN